MTTARGTYQVVWPRGPRASGPLPPARRLDTLAGKTIGELWNYSFRGDEIFHTLEEEFARKYPGVRFVSYQKFGQVHASREEEMFAALPGKLKENGCDAVITGVGC